MIPRVIHYCWFGGNPLPEEAVKCIKTWKKYCPQYEIREWNESNFDIMSCEYVREAYKAKKWAFVSDYARFKILYEHGGIYFDTDVELIKTLETLIFKGSFMGCEEGEQLLVAPGLGLGAEKKMDIYKEIIDYYECQKFYKNDGTINTDTVVKRVTDILYKYGFKGNGEIEYVAGINIYPPEFFCPKNYYTGEVNVTSNTVSIHHYDATWYELEEKKDYEFQKFANRLFGLKFGKILGKPVHLYYRFKLRTRQMGGLKKAVPYFVKKIVNINLSNRCQ